MAIKHVFVLMLENRSFDHMFGFADLRGPDAQTGQATHADDLIQLRDTPQWAETANRHPNTGQAFFPRTGAPWKIYAPLRGPAHEFNDVYEQLCGHGATYQRERGYGPITNDGFVASYLHRGPQDPGLVMRSFEPERIPVLTKLAREFAVCDHWFSSLPGPTWPNRFFVHAATSGGLEDSPGALDIVGREVGPGFHFERGTIFDRLGDDWLVIHGDFFPQVFSLQGMLDDRLHHRFRPQRDLGQILADPNFSAKYVFIEPSYGRVYSDYGRGNSQHATDDVAAGERLIKEVYETIRKSRRWNESVLVITYDEHGGFFDHVAPPAAVPPGDANTIGSAGPNFDFSRLGVRVPAVVVSPLTRRGMIDHRVYDHTSIPATLISLFDLPPRDGRRHLTNRDASAGTFEGLFSLPQPRTDTPEELPDPPVSGYDPDLDADGDLAPDGQMDPAVRGFLLIAFQRRYGVPANMMNNPLVRRFVRISTRVQARDFLLQTENNLRKRG